MVDDAILGDISLPLERPEQRLVCTQNPEGRCGIFEKLCQTSCMRGGPGAGNLTNELGRIGGDMAHLIDQVAVGGLAAVG